MKILLGITFIFAISYVPTLWSYHSNDGVKTNREHKIPNIDTLRKTEESNIISTTSETTTTVINSVTEIISKNETNNTTINNTDNSSTYTSLDDDKYDESRLHFYQLSDIKEKLNNYNCTEKYGRTSLPESCEGYIDCKNGVATSLLCQDGLHFDPENAKSKWPCQYSCDVPCTNVISVAPQYVSRECPHKFGYFKIEDKYNCSSFRICEFGVAYDFECPNGLAFRSDNLRCDWPHKVPECDAEGYAGLQCPDKKEEYIFFRSPTDCQVYYTCIYGVPRRQVCGKYMGFNEDSGVCVPADRVEECDLHLKLAAKADRRTRYLENKYTQDYDDGDGYLNYRHADLSFSRRVRKPKIISFPKYGKD